MGRATRYDELLCLENAALSSASNKVHYIQVTMLDLIDIEALDQ